MSEQSGHVIRIERTLAAAAEEVFDAWTSPEVMRRWFHCAEDWETTQAEVDLRVGGTIRVLMRRPDGSKIEGRGEFTLIDRPQRLTMTWTFDDDATNEQLVEVSFTPADGSTTVVLVNRRISTQDRRDKQDWGWRGCLHQLEALLTSDRRPG